MKRASHLFGFCTATLFIILSFLATAAPSGNDKSFVGLWEGKLVVPGGSLRLVFHISINDKSELTATMDSPDQKANGIPVDQVTTDKNKITLALKALHGVYSGELNAEGNLIKGTWTQNGTSFPLDMGKTDKVSELKRPQEPKRPFPYKDEDVNFVNKLGDTLAATFTCPKTGHKFTAVVFVTGSGPQNRDEELMGHKPFLVISDYLTRNGIATLRFDDRGIGKSKGNFSAATTYDFSDDALAAVEYLKTRKEINVAKIGIIGHSEGGIVAPIAATRSASIGFIIMLAGPGETGTEILDQQTALIMRAQGVPEPDIQNSLAVNRKIFAIIRQVPDSAAAAKQISEEVNAYLTTLPDSIRKKPELSPEALKAQMQQVMSPWFRAFLVLDPRDYLKNVTCPVLAINGSKDLQVPPKENLSEIRKALEAGGNKHFEVKELEGLNHLFQTAQTGSPTEYNTIEETTSPKALEVISNFIKALK